MEKENRFMGFWTFVLLWFGAAVSIAEIMTGGMIAPLGFTKGVLAILLGHLIGTAIFALGGIIGTRERMPAITSTGITFGRYGTYLFSLLNVLQLLGWTAVMVKTAAGSVNTITKSIWQYDNFMVCAIVVGILVAIWIISGRSGMQKLNNVAVGLLFLLTIVLGVVVFKNTAILSKAATGGLSFGAALELNIVMPLSWLPLIADYTRFAKTEKAGAWGSFIGYFFGSSLMFIIGLAAALVSGNSDPSAMMLAAKLGLSALGIVLLSTVTTTFMDVYSAGVSFLNLVPAKSEKTIGLIMAVIGTALALAVPIEEYENFLYAIGSVFAPLFAIVLTDYFLMGQKEDFLKKATNYLAFIVWIFGVVLYYSFIKFDLIFGATLPVMVITGLTYLLLGIVIHSWKFFNK